MAKIIVEQVQGGNSGDALTLPTADGTAGQFMKTDGSGALSFGTLVVAGFPADDNDLMIGMVMSSSARDNVYSTGQWTSSGPNSTYYNDLHDASARTQAWNMMLGDGKPQAAVSENLFYSNDQVGQFHREKIFAHNRRIGHSYRSLHYEPNDTSQSYAGVTFSCMPIRNKGSSSVDVAISTKRSCGSNDYGGSGVMYYTPTGGSGPYAATTGGGWTVLNSYTSNDGDYKATYTVPVPAGRTVLLFMTSAHRYETTYQFKDTHAYAELQTMFTHADIQCDLKMLEALYSCRQPAAIYNASTPYEMYTSCATCYGDR
jgi:hypothetical protein